MRSIRAALLVLAALGVGSQAVAQDTWSPAQREVLEAMDRLSAATAPGGSGADAYAAVLADGFSRWTLGGEAVNDRTSWVASVRDWFDDGWRVADRTVEQVEIVIRGDLAFTRRVVTETFQGPDGERADPGTAALAEVWVRDGGTWRLWRVDARPLGDR